MASAELRIINRRIKSVKSTKKITRAMELIASSRIVKAQQRLTSSNNYTNLLSQIVEELTGSGEMPSSPPVEGTKKITLVVITSDRGLAGAYNTNILKLAEARKAEYENLNNKVEIVTVGKKANGYFKYRNIEPKQNYEGITDEPNFENALEIMTPLVQEFYDGKTNQIEIVYTEYKSAMTQTALYKTVLPFEVEQIAKEIESVEIVTVGKKANGYFKYRNIEPKQNYEGITDEPNFENALEIMTPLVQEFYDGKTNQIEIVYTEYKSAMTQTALYKTVLPFEVEQIAKEIESVGGYTFEPSASQVLSNIIPKYTNATIFSSLLNASTSEHASRMRAMKAATENAEELIKILSRQSNQARQAEITTEISEIVGGAEALAG